MKGRTSMNQFLLLENTEISNTPKMKELQISVKI